MLKNLFDYSVKKQNIQYNYNMEKEILERIKDKVHKLPTTSGVYKMLDRYGNIIYVGKAKKLKQRVSSYFVDTV